MRIFKSFKVLPLIMLIALMAMQFPGEMTTAEAEQQFGADGPCFCCDVANCGTSCGGGTFEWCYASIDLNHVCYNEGSLGCNSSCPTFIDTDECGAGC